MHALVTGARGFIGSAFLRRVVTDGRFDLVTAFARNTNCWTKPRLESHDTIAAASTRGKLRITYGDLNGDISGLCEQVDVVFHFAARTFVDHSLRDPLPFINANMLGTVNILEEARRQRVKAFFNVSTDEVYGQILEGAYDENAPINPRNPYAASKAGADALAIAYHHSFGMWTVVTRTENNYGPYQHPQKALPTFVKKALDDQSLPVYGDGKHVRQWLHVDDHVSALLHLWEHRDKVPGGSVWHVAGNQEITNNELAETILDILGRSRDLITHIPDHDIRPGHDRRYALSCEKLRGIGWTPAVTLREGLTDAVNWYAANRTWLSCRTT